MYSHVNRGRFFGGSLLVAGCCIGAGMLGLPVLSASAGFFPSLFVFFLCWLFMVSTGYLVLEVNLRSGHETSLISMADHTLGYWGKAITWFLFLFLFYSLMVAYISASGSLVTDFLARFNVHTFPSMGGLLFCLLFGLLVYLGTKAVDFFNRPLMLGLIVSYVFLVQMGVHYVDGDLLKRQNWMAITPVIPVAILSFGYHNMIPSLTTYLKRDTSTIKKAIMLGSLIPLFVYLVWEWLILGIVPFEGGLSQAVSHEEIATEALKSAIGNSYVLDVAQAFAFFAIITSFLSVALSFVDFFEDGLKIKDTPSGRFFSTLLVVTPPFLFSLLYPEIFLTALKYAGGFGAVILFGILPAAMAWKGRQLNSDVPQLLPGGKISLAIIILFAVWVITLQF